MNNKNLGGARFELLNAEGRPIRCAVSDANGFARFDNLCLGTYFIKEVNAPVGYAVNHNVFQTTIDVAHPVKEVDVFNESVRGTIFAHVVTDNNNGCHNPCHFNCCCNCNGGNGCNGNGGNGNGGNGGGIILV